jgi:hypothetical protein
MAGALASCAAQAAAAGIGGDFGEFGLSQQVFTVMAHNDGFCLRAAPVETSAPRWTIWAGVGSLSPLAIAVGRDRIHDFQSGVDKIDLSPWYDSFVGKSGFTGSEGELRYVTASAVTILEGDLDGDKVADFQIVLAGTVTPLLNDFIFG